MTLSTTRSLYLAPVRVNLALRFIVVSIRAVSAGVHLALVPDHSRESLALGLAYALSAGALAATSLLSVTRAITRGRQSQQGAVLTLIAMAYALSRSTGIPWLIPHAEHLDVLGLATSAAEVVAALAAALLMTRKEPQ